MTDDTKERFATTPKPRPWALQCAADDLRDAQAALMGKLAAAHAEVIAAIGELRMPTASPASLQQRIDDLAQVIDWLDAMRRAQDVGEVSP
jgi:hypothetical protein